MGDLTVHYSSKSSDWLTPQRIVPLILDVLGEIDLDPCSNDAEHPNIPAKANWDGRNMDGLAHDWYGKVYANVPYGRTITGKWTRHAVVQYLGGHTSKAILLTPARTDTAWFRELWIGTICFVNGRLKFTNKSLPSYEEFVISPAPFPSAFTYFGNDSDKFAEVFGTIGDIVRRVG